SRLSESQPAEVKTLADMIPAGLRAMSLTLTELDGAGGLIVPGQHIDVVAVFKKDTLGKDESLIMLQDVLVLAVAQATSADELLVQNTPTPTKGQGPANARASTGAGPVVAAPGAGAGANVTPTPAAASPTRAATP